jgi:hypothetical protein
VATSNVSRGREWFRAYQIWEHADHILQQCCSEFHLIDVITTLKRAVNQRLTLLDKLYKFKRIPIREKPSDLLKILRYVDIIRPIMVEKLIDIRNAVEHQDAPPPDREACKIFSEFVWYFLRSTDKLVREMALTFNLYPAESDLSLYSVECTMLSEQGWNPTIGGWMPSQLISDEAEDGWLRITGQKSDQLPDYLRDSLESLSGPQDQFGNHRPPTEVSYFEGQIRGPAECLKTLIQLYFKLV